MDKVVAIVTDNASNIVSAARATGWRHIPCFAHTLNLVVQDALQADLTVVNEKIRVKVLYHTFTVVSKPLISCVRFRNRLG